MEELEEALSASEFAEWAERFTMEAEENKRAMDAAKAGR